MAKCVTPAVKLPYLIPDRVSILALTPWSTVLLEWLRNSQTFMKLLVSSAQASPLEPTFSSTPSHPISIFSFSYSSYILLFSNGKLYAFLSSFVCASFPHPLFILLDLLIPRRYKASSYANFCKLLSLLPTSSQIFSFFNVRGHSFYANKTTCKMTFLCSFNIHNLRQQMARQKFVNWMLLSIPQIKSALNFFVIWFWCVNIV
jgi:hypothetical protein